jgi:hypothetical protein
MRIGSSFKKRMPPTKVVAKAGLNNVTAAMCRYQRFGLGVQFSTLVLNFNSKFQWPFVPGWTFNELPALANTRTLRHF